MQDQPTLDIIVPCYNPSKGWEHQLTNSFLKLQEALEQVEINLILVNDGSSQGIDQGMLEEIRNGVGSVDYISYDQNMGKGHALREGVKRSNGDIQIFTDIDFPYRIESIRKVYHVLEEGKDIALGYREVDYYKKVPLFRKLLSQSHRWLLKRVLKLTITDTQCGLKGFRAKGKDIFLQTTINRFLFDLEFVMLASDDPSIKVVPVKVQLRDEVVFSSMHIGILAREMINFIQLFFRKRKHG